MKKIIIPILISLLVISCNDFLDTENLEKKDTGNFPQNEAEMSTMLTGIYKAVRDMEIDSTGNCSFVVSEVLSDDRFAGGGPDDRDFRNLEKYELTSPNIFANTWMFAYQGIFRANNLLESLDQIEWKNADNRSNIAGQTYFLRAYAYFYLARMFGSAPLVLVTDPVDLPRAEADEMYAQIASDLKNAIEMMPSTPKVSERGRTSKWAAQALMARVFLFYTGYYKKDSLPLAGEGGGQITKQQVIAYLDDCIANSGYKLIPDFRNLWPYSNEVTKADGYPFAVKNNLSWIKEDNINDEVLLAWHSSANVNWTKANIREANRINLYFSLREQAEADIFPFGKGWGFGTVNSNLWKSWPDKDNRKKGSIIDVEDKVNEMPKYTWGSDKQQDETGYWQKKYIAVNVKLETGGYINYSRAFYGDIVINDYQLNNTQDLVAIRFADVLLMAAELKADAGPLNEVRARAGLDPVGYSVEALRNERRWELAFEGQRYYDLLRYGLDYAGNALAAQNGVDVKNENVAGKKDIGDVKARLQATGGFMPIPENEIALSDGQLKQTPGW